MLYNLKRRQIQQNKHINIRIQDMSITDQHLAAYIQTIFVNYDKDKSGTLEANEMTAFLNDIYRAMGSQQSISPQQAQQALGIMDKDFNGRVSKAQLFEVLKHVLMKQGFYVDNQNIYSNTGHNYNEAIEMWRVSQQMGNTLPYFGQVIKASISQNSGYGSPGQNQGFNQSSNNMGTMNNQYGNAGNNQYQAYDGSIQNLQNQFVKSHINQANPSMNYQGGTQQVDPLLNEQMQLGQMIAVQNEMISQYQQNLGVVTAQQQAQMSAQLAQHQAQVEMQLSQVKMHAQLMAAQQELMQQQQQQMINQQHAINMGSAGFNSTPNNNQYASNPYAYQNQGFNPNPNTYGY